MKNADNREKQRDKIQTRILRMITIDFPESAISSSSLIMRHDKRTVCCLYLLICIVRFLLVFEKTVFLDFNLITQNIIKECDVMKLQP